MSVPPVPRPPEESRRRQRRFLIGAAVAVSSVIAALVVLDRAGTDREQTPPPAYEQAPGASEAPSAR